MDQIVGYATLARTRQAQGEEAGAREACQKAERLSGKMRGYLYARRWVEDCQVRLWTAQSRLDAVAHWVGQTDLRVDDEINYERELDHLILARALVALGRQARTSEYMADALQLLARLLDAAKAAGWMGKAIEILILQAMAHWACEDTEQALTALQRALTLAEPEGYVRVFLDEGAPMARLLYQAASGSLTSDYVQKLLPPRPDQGPTTDDEPLSAVQRPSSSHVPVGVEPLSARELQVLWLVAEGLTNREIASRLTVALSTVKVHTRNIYGKLDVHSRVQAVARARDLGLL
jgi:LuxR family maltose regulon positive regulatory protein